jgi:hypothetical protein
MSSRKVVVAAHGHCFDGLVSAAMFTHLRKSIGRHELRFSYRSCGYGPNMQTVPERWLNGDENAIVDFRYGPSDKLTWYFDHHVTAFASEEQREQALAVSERYVFDPGYGSCTKLIADVGRERHGVSFTAHQELIRWADQIDSASFATAYDAIDGRDPVMQLASVVEQHGNGPLYEKLVPMLLDQPLADVATHEEIQQLWKPIAAAREQTHARIKSSLEQRGAIAFVDLHQESLRSSGKFVAYALAPKCVYAVALIRMRQHFKISIGYNPWCDQERSHDIGTLCQRYGGGGHPVVGAISLPLSKLEQARTIADEVMAELNG